MYRRKIAMTTSELKTKLKSLGNITKKQRNSIVCILIGHSRIRYITWGCIYCARCDEMLIDGLVSTPDPEYFKDDVYIECPHGSNCKKCAEHKKKLTWKDEIFV